MSEELSLVSSMDDLTRYEGTLHEGLEEEFLKFIQSLHQHQPDHLQGLRHEQELKALQVEHDITRQELGHWKANFEEMRSKFESEQKKRMELEHNMTDLVKLLGEVREVVYSDNTLPDETKDRFALWQQYRPREFMLEKDAEESSLDYDKSGEILDFETVLQAFSPGQNNGNNNSLTVDTHISKDLRSTPKSPTSDTRPGIRSPLSSVKKDVVKQDSLPGTAMLLSQHTAAAKRRSFSEPEAIILGDPSEEICLSSDKNSVASNGAKKSITPRIQNKSMSGSNISGEKQSSRTHDFTSKTVFKPETCVPCGRRIKFSKQALKCHNCRITCHPECKSSAPLPCVHVPRTPIRVPKTVADFAPDMPPHVPAIIVYCVNEVDARGKDEVGLYRLSAPEREVAALKVKFTKGKSLPNLRTIDVHVLCATVKDFLRHLEPLIPKLTWKEFASAAALKDIQESQALLVQYINQLPLPNRDTLAFLILHWQRIAGNPVNKMPVKNLAMVLGPTIVGNSSHNADTATMLEEQAIQVQVMEKLLLIPDVFWNRFMNEQRSLLLPDTRTFATSTRLGTTIPSLMPRGNFTSLAGGIRGRLFTSPSHQYSLS